VPAVNNELDRPVRFAAEGEVPEDYVFERIGKISMPENVRMSELFGEFVRDPLFQSNNSHRSDLG